MRGKKLQRKISFALAAALVIGNLSSFKVQAEEIVNSKKDAIRDMANKLIITEIHADDIKREELGVGTADIMEFVEVYNNSNEDINFNEYYDIVYDYNTNKKKLTVTSSTIDKEAIVPAKTAVALWVRRTSEEAKKLTIEQFRDAYNLEDDTVILNLSGQDGLNNTDRGFELHDKEGNVLWKYRYKAADVSDGKSVELMVPSEGNDLAVYKQKSDPTPCSIEKEQVDKAEIINIPSILITELSPHPLGDYRKGSGNQYEFIEVYNNSNEMLNLKGHTLFYLYPNETKPKKWTITEDTSIEPYSTAVIWFAKEAITAGYTNTKDFNTHYNTTLNDNDIIFYDNSKSSDFNIPNATNRGFALSSSDSIDDVIVEAWYNSTNSSSEDSILNEIRNSSISYVYPKDGSKTMVRKDNRAYSDPGILSEDQIPTINGLDNIAPVINYEKGKYNMGGNENYTITLESNEKLSESKVMYGLDSNSEIDYKYDADLVLKSFENGKYIYEGSININTNGSYRYIIQSIDEASNVRRLPYNSRGYTLTVNTESSDTVNPIKYEYGLSLEDGDVISNFSEIYATGNSSKDNVSIKINGQVVESTKSLGGKSVVGFQGSGIDQIYKTSVSGRLPNSDIEYFARVLPKYVQGAWYNYEVNSRYLLDPSTITIHSGNENVPYDLSVHDKYFGVTNFDDFEVLNIHLVLPSGKLMKPLTTTTYTGRLDVKESPYFENVKYSIGDGDAQTNPNVNKPLMIDFNFDIPEEEYISQYTNLDTNIYSDGKYNVEMLENGVVVDSAEVIIDNTEATIGDILVNEEKLEDGKILRGNYTLNVNISDETSGVESLVTRLDGNIVELPYSLKTSSLSIGNHNISVEVKDKAGNISRKTVNFVTENEKADIPKEVGPDGSNGEVKDKALLSAIVNDPFNEDMNVQFKMADKYDITSNKMSASEGLDDNGMTDIDNKEYENFAYEDNKYVVTESTEGAPYQQFEVEVNTDSNIYEEVELYWKGNTEANKNINMYAFNYSKGNWEVVVNGLGAEDGEDIVLKVVVNKNDFVKENKVKVKLQVNGKANIDIEATPYTAKADEEDDDFSIMWFTDTQYYAESYPYIFDRITDWTVEEYQKGTFEYVIHTGDIVNKADDIKQWDIADYNMKKLDLAGVPYGVLAGNHDSIINGIDYSNYKKYFGENRFNDKSWYGGSMDDNRNHYDLVSFNGYDFVVLYIGFGTETEEETIQWANEVLNIYSDRNAIVGLHAYLESNGTRSEMSQTFFDKVIVPNENVKIVLSGHYHAAALNIAEIANEDGSTREVFEVLTDYQAGPEGGEGYLRLINFDPEEGTVNFSTYSPYTDKSEYFGSEIDNFTLDIDLIGKEKSVATDYISVNIYTDTVIGVDEVVKSGDKATTLWSNLNPNKDYFWYMDIENSKGVETRSDIYKFTTSDFKTESGDNDENTTIVAPEDGASNNTTDIDKDDTLPKTGVRVNPLTIAVIITLLGFVTIRKRQISK